jgi:hypothetical protein
MIETVTVKKYMVRDAGNVCTFEKLEQAMKFELTRVIAPGTENRAEISFVVDRLVNDGAFRSRVIAALNAIDTSQSHDAAILRRLNECDCGNPSTGPNDQ